MVEKVFCTDNRHLNLRSNSFEFSISPHLPDINVLLSPINLVKLRRSFQKMKISILAESIFLPENFL